MKKNEKTPLFHTPKVIEVSKNLVWPVRVIFLTLSYYFIEKFYFAYQDKFFFFGKQFYLAEKPILFNIMIIMFLVCSIGFFWQAFKVRANKI